MSTAHEDTAGGGSSLARLSLQRPVTATVFFVALMVMGLLATVRLPLEFFPAFDVPFLFVELPYPGSTPEEVERSIIRPAEEALATLSGIQEMRSFSRADGGGIQLRFRWGRNVAILASEARERMDVIRSELPSDLQHYRVLKFSTTDAPVLRVRFASDRDLSDAWGMLNDEVKRRLERLPGVARVDLSGIASPEVEIAISPDRIAAAGLSLNELSTRLQAANFSVSAGEIDDGTRRIRVQPVGEITRIDALRELVINERGLRLADLADVQLKPGRIDYGRRLEGRTAIGIELYKERDANLVEVSRVVNAELARIGDLPDFAGIQFITIQDQAEGVTSSLTELAKAGALGSLLSILVLFFFLRHWASTLMVTTAIPICFIITLGAMYFFGSSLNIISMMGLLLGIGLLVDNAVVVVESIYQRREKYPDDPRRCAIEGTRSVQLAISAGTLTSIIVFVPNLFGERNEISLFMGEIAVTITVSLLASWLVAVSLIPMISARIKSPPKVDGGRGIVARMQDRYARMLRWSLTHRGWTVAAIAALVLISVAGPTVSVMSKADMFPQNPGREFEIYLQWKGSYSLDQVSAEVGKLETFLDSNRERYQIRQIYSWFSERGGGGLRVSLLESGSGLRPSPEVQEQIRKELPKLATANIVFRGQQSGGSEGLQVNLYGDSSETLRELGEEVVRLLAPIEVLRDVHADVDDQSREVRVSVDRDRAALYGFSAEEVANYVGIAIRGAPLREFRYGEREIPMWVRFGSGEDASIEDLSGFMLRTPGGEMIPLMAVVNASVERGPAEIRRLNRRSSMAIAINLADGMIQQDARQVIEAAMKPVNLPAGYRWSFGADFDRSDEAAQRMAFNTLLALLMIVIVMAALFESLVFPAAIVSSVFFSFFGVFWLFFFTGTTFSIMASIGMLVLMGVVVNNGIVMVEHINALRRGGMSRTDALVAGSRERLRPILMTMGTTVLGMLPLCIGGIQVGGDGPPYYPMARAIVGGLIFSTLVSLAFLPTIYALLDDFSRWTAQAVRLARRPRTVAGQ